MRILHWYHIYAPGAWSEAVREHGQALTPMELARFSVTLVGPHEDRAIAKYMAGRRLPAVTSWREVYEAHEDFTLAAIWDYVQADSSEFAVLYAHTKGAYNEDEYGTNAAWRRGMTEALMGSSWLDCLYYLSEGYDTVGCHWVTPDDYREHDLDPPPNSLYGGNFWWARASYLRKLPPPSHVENRYAAEWWIGSGNPNAHDLKPGWPKY